MTTDADTADATVAATETGEVTGGWNDVDESDAVKW